MVLGKPSTKCQHGIYKAGADAARYCSQCNPHLAGSGKVFPKIHQAVAPQPEPKELDCFEYMALPVGVRIGISA